MKKECIVCDIDGTLAHMSGRILRHGKKVAPFADWDAYDDKVDEKIAEIVNLFHNSGRSIVICSGRKSNSKKVLQEWLLQNKIPFDEIFMRDKNDNRKDSIIKSEIYYRDIKPFYEVFCVLDDRNQVVEKWREIGLKTLQVSDGNF